MARDLNGTVQFAFINSNNPLNEKMRVQFWAYRPPMAFYIEPETNSAYVFEQILVNYNETIAWIKERQFLKSSPLIFTPVPAELNIVQLYFEYARRDIRNLWD